MAPPATMGWSCTRCDLSFSDSVESCLLCAAPQAVFKPRTITTTTNYEATRHQEGLHRDTSSVSGGSHSSRNWAAQTPKNYDDHLGPEIPSAASSITYTYQPKLGGTDAGQLERDLDRIVEATKSRLQQRDAIAAAARRNETAFVEAVSPRPVRPLHTHHLATTEDQSVSPDAFSRKSSTAAATSKYSQAVVGREAISSPPSTSGQPLQNELNVLAHHPHTQRAVSPLYRQLLDHSRQALSTAAEQQQQYDFGVAQPTSRSGSDASPVAVNSAIASSVAPPDDRSASAVAPLVDTQSEGMTIELLLGQVKRLTQSNADLEAELRSTRRQVAASVARDADTDVTMQLADNTIVDLRDRLQREMRRVDVPQIVMDEFQLRYSDFEKHREDLLTMTKAVFVDANAVLSSQMEAKTLDRVAVEAAVAKNATVVKLREEIASLELRVVAAEKIAKEKSVRCGEVAQELAEMSNQQAMAGVIAEAKEAQLKGRIAQLEMELAGLKQKQQQ